MPPLNTEAPAILEHLKEKFCDADWEALADHLMDEAQHRARANEGCFDDRDFLLAVIVFYQALGAVDKLPHYWVLCYLSGRNFLRDKELADQVDRVNGEREHARALLPHIETVSKAAHALFAANDRLKKAVRELSHDTED